MKPALKLFLLKQRTSVRALILGVFAACLSALGVLRAETVFWSENFDDGNANNRWYADNGVWQLGSPTVGPATNSAGCRAHSCPNCATTGLTGNYLAHQDSRLIRIAPFVVPSADQFPRLRFWQWFSFAGSANGDGGSYGYVEIKPGTNAWQALPLYPGAPLSSTYHSSSSGVWSRPSIDLAPFAGQTVQLAFTFHSAAATALGWYVDDVAVVTGTPVFNNPEGFELGLGDWSVDFGTWQVGVPTSGPGSAYDGTNCAASVLGGNYASYVDSSLISPAFTVPASNSYPRLRFWQWFSFAGSANGDGGSYGYVEIKAGTNAWQALPLYPGAPLSATYHSSSSGVWSRPSIDLTPFAGQTVQLAFTFHSAAATALGWYVDDVAVVTGAPVFSDPECFELGIGDWSVDFGTWQVGSPSCVGLVPPCGTNCAGTVLCGNYASYVGSDFISPPFIVPASSPSLRFWHWFSFGGSANGDGGSYGQVYIRAGTNAWQPLPDAKYTGQSGTWTEPYFDLTPYAGQTAQLDFYFHSAAAVALGWYVDDIQISPIPPLPTNPLTVTANSANRFYGDPNPAFTATYSGFVNGDTTNVLSGGPGFTCPATNCSPVGTYPIYVTNGTLTASNYVFKFAPGTLTIMPRPISVTAVPCTKVYDGTLGATGAVPAITPGPGVITPSPLVCGGTAASTEAYNDKNAGGGKLLVPAVTINDGNNGNNYAVATNSLFIGVITPAPVAAINVTASNKVYDGMVSATLSFGNPDLLGVLPGDIGNVFLNTTGYTAWFTNVGPGTNIPVTVTNVTLGGTPQTRLVPSRISISFSLCPGRTRRPSRAADTPLRWSTLRRV
jgi:hypothetical protein